MIHSRERSCWSEGMVLVFVVCLLLVGQAFADEARAADNEAHKSGIVILDQTSHWRCFPVLRPMLFGTAQDPKPAPETTTTEDERRASSVPPPGQPNSPLPPANWMTSDFDDAGWWYRKGPFFVGDGGARRLEGAQQGPFLSLLCLRGRFLVSAPARVRGLRLSARFRGGLVAYVNGKEIGRTFLAPGKIGPETLAQEYAPQVFQVLAERMQRRDKDKADIPASAFRDCEVDIPSTMLTKGINVLALEVHRPPFAPQPPKERHLARRMPGIVLGLSALSLVASGSEGLTRREALKGVRVWNVNPLQLDWFDWVASSDPDPGLSGQPTRIVATRNGTFSGVVVVTAPGPIRSLKAELDEFKHVEGGPALPPAAAEVRYALRRSRHEDFGSGLSKTPFIGEDEGRRQRENGEQQVWVRVRVPADATAGEYLATLRVSCNGADSVDVPVNLKVCSWTLPDTSDYRSWMDFIQSPDTLALTYDTPMFSDEHFKLIERTFRLIGEAGNRVVYVPLVMGTHFGNEQTMVRWVKNKDGSFAHDYTVMERYLDLAQKHMKLDVVCLYVWDWYLGARSRPHAGDPVRVSLLDPETGDVSVMEGPRYLDGDAYGFLKPVAEEIRARLKRRGLEKVMMLGVHGGSPVPSKEVVQFLNRVFPDTPWVYQDHGYAKSVYGMVPVGYLVYAYGPSSGTDPAVKRMYGWQRPDLVAEYPRDSRYWQNSLSGNRLLVEWNLQGGQRGIGRMTADFWKVPFEDSRGRTRWHRVVDRFGSQHWANLTLCAYTWNWLEPGPEGAISTTGFEMLREGLEECEARIFIEQVLTNEDACKKLGDEACRRYQDLLDERQRHNLWTGKSVYCNYRILNPYRESGLGFAWYAWSGWQDRSEKLFEAAAEVARHTGLQK